ncbi:MAG: DHA2 family efflux MFS transporter permease subunit [Acidimicrobiales bacterium]
MRAPSYKNAVLVVYMLGLFIQILDATVVNVALPTLAAEFTVEVTEIEWVVLGFLLSLAIGIPAAGWLGDRFGSKRVFLIALGVFTGASALCGAAGSVDQLVAFRILQGLGAGLITPIGSAMLYRAFPVHERARAAAAVVGVAVIAPALGPVVGGIIVQTTSWRWIFFVNIPIGAAAMVLGWLWLEESTEPTASRFDGPGLVLSGGGLAMLLYALSIAPDEGWTSPVVLLVGAGAVAAFAAMTVIELRIEQPMLQLRLFGERMFRTTNIAALFTYAGFLSQIFLFTLYLQVLRGSSPFEAGLTQSPQAVGVFLMSNLAGHRLYVAIGPRRLMTAGTAGTGLVTAIIALTDVDTPLWVLGTMMLARGLVGRQGHRHLAVPPPAPGRQRRGSGDRRHRSRRPRPGARRRRRHRGRRRAPRLPGGLPRERGDVRAGDDRLEPDPRRGRSRHASGATTGATAAVRRSKLTEPARAR